MSPQTTVASGPAATISRSEASQASCTHSAPSRPPVRDVHRDHSDAAAGRGDGARLGVREAGPAGEPRDHIVQPDTREDRHAVPRRSPWSATAYPRSASSSPSSAPNASSASFGLLQADHVGLPLVQPRQQTGDTLLDRVDVPRRDPHRSTVPPACVRLRRARAYHRADGRDSQTTSSRSSRACSTSLRKARRASCRGDRARRAGQPHGRDRRLAPDPGRVPRPPTDCANAAGARARPEPRQRSGPDGAGRRRVPALHRLDERLLQHGGDPHAGGRFRRGDRGLLRARGDHRAADAAARRRGAGLVDGRADEMATLLEALVRSPPRTRPAASSRDARACCATRWSGSASRPELIELAPTGTLEGPAIVRGGVGKGDALIYYHGHFDVVPAQSPSQFEPNGPTGRSPGVAART